MYLWKQSTTLEYTWDHDEIIQKNYNINNWLLFVPEIHFKQPSSDVNHIGIDSQKW
jgi:hypothetical protein